MAPVGAGYLAAKLAKAIPLFHGFVTGVLTSAAFVLIIRGEDIVADVVIAVFVTVSGLFGGWLQRFRKSRA
ncbi:MAG TPA: hypothetical protein VNS57_17920 [Steroidobacteraceae bacterium]|nr:hypothetical protein [Steroidobacteraceae bacterium]